MDASEISFSSETVTFTRSCKSSYTEFLSTLHPASSNDNIKYCQNQATDGARLLLTPAGFIWISITLHTYLLYLCWELGGAGGYLLRIFPREFSKTTVA